MLKIKAPLTLLTVILFITNNQVLCHCPEGEPLKPCTCEHDPDGYMPESIIVCTDVTGAQLKEIFSKLEHLEEGEKHFHYLKLTGKGLDELLEQTFDDITIDHIRITDAPNLAKIHINAFKNTHIVLEYLVLENLPSLDVSNLFEIINKFRSIESVSLINLAKLEEIPSMALKTLKKLRNFVVKGQNIKRISEKAFFNMNSLSFLEITDTSLNKIGENIFVFSAKSNHYFTISLFGNKLLNCESFSPGTFSKAERPLSLDFSGYHYTENHDRKQITCLPEDVFKPFFNAHENNDVDLYQIDFNCTNCKSAWLKGATEFHERLLSIQCEGGKEITDPDNFKGC